MNISKHRVLLLGGSGMLGHMVGKYLQQFYEVESTVHRWPSLEFKNEIKESNADFLINCIGAIPQRTQDFDINWELPIWLDQNFKSRIIHPGTDCEMDADQYGISKKKAADWIKSTGSNTKMIKASIIGPEISKSSSMLYWFLSNEDHTEVNGYTNHLWNGITTFYWAKFSKDLMENWDNYNTTTVLGSNCISKFDMCTIFNEIYDRKIIINEFETKISVNKCLNVDIKCDNIDTQLRNQKRFYYGT